MEPIGARLETIGWESVSRHITDTGYAIIPSLLTDKECSDLVKQYANEELYRKKIVMERYRFGQGEYKYFSYPLPGIIQTIRETVYPQLAPVANNWMKALNMSTRFPGRFAGLQFLCRENAQDKPTVLILQYGPGGYNTLHRTSMAMFSFLCSSCCS